MTEFDPVARPKHYNSHPSGIECIQIVEHMGFCIGNAIKYLQRADEKGNAIEDLKKSLWYINREIEKRERQQNMMPETVSVRHRAETTNVNVYEEQS